MFKALCQVSMPLRLMMAMEWENGPQDQGPCSFSLSHKRDSEMGELLYLVRLRIGLIVSTASMM